MSHPHEYASASAPTYVQPVQPSGCYQQNLRHPMCKFSFIQGSCRCGLHDCMDYI